MAARPGALLTPQGKILFDFVVFEAPGDAGGGFYLDVGKAYAPDLTKRLGFYKLRAKVVIEDLSDPLAVVVGWGDASMPDPEVGLVGPDPRLPALAACRSECASPTGSDSRSRGRRNSRMPAATRARSRLEIS